MAADQLAEPEFLPITDSVRILLTEKIKEAAELEALQDFDSEDLADRIMAVVEKGGEEDYFKLSAVSNYLSKPFGKMLEKTLFSVLRKEPAAIRKVLNVDIESLRKDPEPRQLIKALFYRTLSRVNRDGTAAGSAASDEKIRQIVELLERGVYNYTIESSQEVCTWSNLAFVSYYSERACTVQNSIDPSSALSRKHGLNIAKQLLDGVADPLTLGCRSAMGLCPRAFEEEKSVIEIRSQQVVHLKTSSLWPCPQCHAKSCTYTEVQDRSADEPASIYCVCTKCGIQYKGA